MSARKDVFFELDDEPGGAVAERENMCGRPRDRLAAMTESNRRICGCAWGSVVTSWINSLNAVPNQLLRIDCGGVEVTLSVQQHSYVLSILIGVVLDEMISVKMEQLPAFLLLRGCRRQALAIRI